MKYRWQWQLQNKPQELWPILTHLPQPVLEGRRGNFIQKFLMGGVIDDASCQTTWVKNHSLVEQLGFTEGHLKGIEYEINLLPKGSGTVVRYELNVEANSTFARMALPYFFVKKYQKKLSSHLKRSDKLLLQDKKAGRITRQSYLPQSRQERLKELSQKLIDEKFSEPLTKQFCKLLVHEPSCNLYAMRPYAYTDQLGVPPRKTLKLFLTATHYNILEFYWLITCPYCKNWGITCSTLADINGKYHCQRCQKEFQAILDNNVEIVFRPHPSVRPLPQREQTSSTTPTSAPRIVLQQTLKPKSIITLPSPLHHTNYMVRVFGNKKELWTQLSLDDQTASEVYLEVNKDKVESLLQKETQPPQIKLANKTDEVQRIIIEEGFHQNERATALEAHTCQYFRTHFAATAKPPKEPLSVSDVTFMTVSLSPSHNGLNNQFDQGNTGKLREVFDLENRVIDFHDGAIVDYMAGTISAAFTQAQDAVGAAIALMKDFKRFNNTLICEDRMSLKVSLYQGPCYVVDFNGAIEFMGATMTTAHTIRSKGIEGDLILPQELATEPAVAHVLDNSGFNLEPFDMNLDPTFQLKLLKIPVL